MWLALICLKCFYQFQTIDFPQKFFEAPTLVTTPKHLKDDVSAIIDADNNAITEWIEVANYKNLIFFNNVLTWCSSANSNLWFTYVRFPTDFLLNDVSFYFRALPRQTSRCAWRIFNAMTLITTPSRLIIWLLGVSMLFWSTERFNNTTGESYTEHMEDMIWSYKSSRDISLSKAVFEPSL